MFTTIDRVVAEFRPRRDRPRRDRALRPRAAHRCLVVPVSGASASASYPFARGPGGRRRLDSFLAREAA